MKLEWVPTNGWDGARWNLVDLDDEGNCCGRIVRFEGQDSWRSESFDLEEGDLEFGTMRDAAKYLEQCATRKEGMVFQ